jgi:aminomuconate-semialdehyde/2-hydroxymuconate-6-semialdehyde dehydrogenase
MEKILNYINGQLVEAIEQNQFEVVQPATGKPYTTAPLSTSADLEKAIHAADAAFEKWAGLALDERCQWLLKIAGGIEAHFDEFVQAESMDNGKPVSLAARVDIPRSISNFQFFAGAAQHFASESHYTPNSGINYTIRKPLGVVGCISPWNLPLYLFTWKIAPALAAGNCVVAKPSDVTPYTAFLLSKVCVEIGLPKGVLNIVHGGVDTGKEIVAHPRVKAISFTGSTRAGEDIARTAAPMFKKISLELGGKNPNIIFDDADIDDAVNTSVLSSFSNQGQICLCGSRMFIHERIYTTFKEKFVAKVRELKVGDPNEAESRVGAVVSKQHEEKVLSYITLAKQEGGTILCGGEKVNVPGRCADGYFIAPTVIEGLTYNCRTNQEEIFGPVVTITPFSSEEEVLQMANSVQYGLAASLWTNDIKRAHRVADKLECGIVWINSWMVRDLRTPFGGVKSSGVGREGGWEAMRFFTDAKNVFVKY